MGHLNHKYTHDYFLGGVDGDTGRTYGILGHADFLDNRTHDRHRDEFNFTSAFVGSLAGLDVLDIGFGRGDHIPLFLKEGVRSYSGIDFSPTAVDIALKKFRDQKLRLSANEAIQLNSENAFDLIIMFDVVEHIPVYEMEIIWSKIYRALRPGGRVVISTPIFDNPNVADHSDEIPSVCGMHCNKQTHGTLMRSFLKNGFTAGCRNDRIYGLLRTADLHLFAEELRDSYLKFQHDMVTQLGIVDFEGELSGATARKLVPGAGRVVMGCVVDNHPKFIAQALRLLQSVRWFGRNVAGVNFFVCCVDEMAPHYIREFERLGAFVRKISRFSDFHPHSNKLQFLTLPEIKYYDTVVLLDCDTLIVQDPSFILNEPVLRAKIADLPTVNNDAFVSVFKHFGCQMTGQDYNCTSDGSPTIWYCNSGVLVFPAEMITDFVPVWIDFNRRLSGNLNILGPYKNYCDQVSLSLAFASNPVPFKELPVSMNFPLHLTHLDSTGMNESDPVIIHYHDLVDASGYLLPTSHPAAQKRVEMFNELVRESRKKRFDNRSFWDFRYSHSPELGSGMGSRGEVLNYKKKLMTDMIQRIKPSSILDIGCGDCAVFADMKVGEYQGVDVSPVVIQRNRTRMPRGKFFCGDFTDLELDSADLTICLDVLIHISDPEAYQLFVKNIVARADRCGIVSGYEEKPQEGENIFYHEPLRRTLERYGARDVREIGRYRQVTIWYFEKAVVGFSGKRDFSSANWLSAPVFLIGAMRSGTTLLAGLLGHFPGIINCPFELKDVWSSAGVPMASPKTRDTVCCEMSAADVRPGQAEKLSSAFLERMNSNSSGKVKNAVFLNKNPHLCNKLPFVNELFPDARFIWIHRSLPSVVSSLRRLFEDVHKRQQTWHCWPEDDPAVNERCWNAIHQREFPVGIDPKRAFPGGSLYFLAEYWMESNRAVMKYLSTLPSSRWLEVEEEALVNDPYREIQRCLSFLGQAQEIPSDIVKTIDSSRNNMWEYLLTVEEQDVLKKFINEHKTQIKAVFPAKNRDSLYGAKNVSPSQAEAEKIKSGSAVVSEKARRQRPVCIAGMHRSGTSMVSRLLNLCGLFLGQEKDLVSPAQDNPEGFWESNKFLRVNEEILTVLKGAWDLPPIFSDGWESGSEILPIREKAIKLAGEFKDCDRWGWKDPRNSLTIVFWKNIFPELRTVVCLRNPLDVARSLYKRGYSSKAFSLDLWLTYNHSLVSALQRGQRLITHYDSYFIDPKTELKRVLDFLDLKVSEDIVDKACETVSGHLRHSHFTREDLLKEGIAPEAVKLYDNMCAEAGPVYWQPPEDTSCLSIRPEKGVNDNDTVCPERSEASSTVTFSRSNENGTSKRDPSLPLLESILPAFDRFFRSLITENISRATVMQAGILCYRLSLYNESKECFRKILSSDPDDIDALNNLGAVCFQLKEYNTAYDVLKRSIELAPHNQEARQNLLALQQRMQEEWDERAAEDARYYIHSSKREQTEEEFDSSGRKNVRDLILKDIKIISGANDPKSMTVLEIGCGIGRMTRHMADIFGEVHGVDVSGEMIRRGRERLRSCPNVFLYKGNGKDLSLFNDMMFDFVFSFIVFQHIPFKEVIFNYIREANRVLKPNGVFKFQVHGEVSQNYLKSPKNTWHGEPVTEDDIRKISEEAGFELLSMGGQGTQYSWYSLKKIIARKDFSDLEKNNGENTREEQFSPGRTGSGIEKLLDEIVQEFERCAPHKEARL